MTASAIETYDIRQVEHLPDEEYRTLTQASMFSGWRPTQWSSLVDEDTATRLAERKRAYAPGYQLRIGAFCGEELVGFTHGWQKASHQFFMALSSVAPSHRRRGLYSRLLDAVIATTRADGFAEIRSMHSANNNPILITKLRAGFTICGFEQDLNYGTLVQLRLPLLPVGKQLSDAAIAPPSIHETKGVEQ